MPDAVSYRIDEIGAEWEADRRARQARRELHDADFDRLREAGILRLPVPVEHGGYWSGPGESFRALCDIYRRLATADASVALVSSMHPAVIMFWLASPDPSQPDWEVQRRAVFASAMDGDQWGTITSEPGSGGDLARTRATAARLEGESSKFGDVYAVSGDKHFGSGSGVTDHMITTALPEGESDPMFFVLDVRDRPWDGTAGLDLIAEWDGMGMQATQSHAMHLNGVPAARMAWTRPLDQLTVAAAPYVTTLFTAVVLGVLDAAVEHARTQIGSRREQLRAYEQVEWSRAEQDHWLAQQAYDGALRAVESGDSLQALRAGIRAKQGVAELAEATLLRLTRVLGGGTFSQRSPFAHWFEDVRALGFLRPPWGLAYDTLFITSLPE